MSTLIQAQNSLDNKNYRKAYKLFVLALEKEEEERTVALQGLAECLYFLGKRNDAIQYANEALALEPKSARAHLILAYSYSDNLDFDKGILEIQQTLALTPDMVDALTFMSGIYISQNKIPEALKTLSKVFDIDKNNWIGHYNMGLIRQREKSYRDAATEFLLAYRLRPSIRPLLRLSEIYISQYLMWFILLSFILLFVSMRFFHLFWMPMLYSGLGMLYSFLQFVSYRNQRYLRNIFFNFIAGLAYYFIVFIRIDV
jgi:tetratricopeptide (TPR) repeat protein